MHPDQTAPFRSSLIWVHSVCNIGYLSTRGNHKVCGKVLLNRIASVDCNEIHIYKLPVILS